MFGLFSIWASACQEGFPKVERCFSDSNLLLKLSIVEVRRG